MNFTTHFDTEQLLSSETASKNGFTEQFSPPDAVLTNLKDLCENVLEPLREKLGRPVKVSSGYRCQRLNEAIGGEPNSQHRCTGGNAAADTVAADMDIQDWYYFIKTSGIAFDELIIEHDSHWNMWCHISYDRNKPMQRGICMIGKKLDTGGTECVADGYGSFITNQNLQN